MITKKCKLCGKEFLVKNYRKDTAMYCSRHCYSKDNYINTLGKVDYSHLKGNQFRKGKKPTNAFSKGHIPWNKGLKGIHLSQKSEFKKGQVGNSHVPVGTITSKIERNKRRNMIKIAEPNKWTYLYSYIWEQANGKIPKGYVLHHINFISDDDRLENLICISRAEHVNIHRKELRKAYNEKRKFKIK